MRAKRRLLLQALVASPLFANAAAAPTKGSSLALVELPLLDGGTFRPAQAEGKVLVLYWWASWCPFCREMTPHVEKLWRAHRERGLLVLGLSIDKTAEAAAAHLRKFGYTFPVAMHDPRFERALPKPKSVPTTWVRDRQGTLVEVIPGQMFPEDVADLGNHLRGGGA